MKYAFPDEFDSITEENVVDYFNNAYFTEDPKVINSLGMYDAYRGYGAYDYGSIVWADFHSWMKDDYDGYAELNGGTLIVNGEETDTIAGRNDSRSFVALGMINIGEVFDRQFEIGNGGSQ